MFKRIVAALICVGMLLSAVGVAETGMSDAEIIDCTLDLFSLLAAVPRPSHHEEKIGAFFVEWVREQGLTPVQDKVGNVMFEVPATAGMEDKALCILQGHMDMVVAVADGTSLGADDGTGCVLMMAAALGKMAHGPLRCLVTVDEEDGMDGAQGMDPAWLDGASYLINIDNEAAGQVLVSSAAGDFVNVSAAAEYAEAAGDLALTVELSGLLGGHSGIDIDKGRLNALIGLASFLKALDESGVAYELASFEGGTARNAIPSKAVCAIVIRAEDRDAVNEAAETWFEALKAAYAAEPDMAYTLTEAEGLGKTISETQKDDAVRFVTEIINGVYTMSADMEGLVESSSNLGVFNLNEDGISGATYVRSSVAALQTEILDAQTALAEACGYAVSTDKASDAWPVDPNSRMTELAQETYRALTGKEIDVCAIHAGLECGTFKAMNPALDMISIGPDIHDPHSIKETLYLDSMPETWRMVEGILARLG